VTDPASLFMKLASDSSLVSTQVDTDLLHRYCVERDESAFTELVRRNGPHVLRVCWHVLGEADADDAFQAVFLLLAQSGKRFTQTGSLAGWLHAVAVRIAHRARKSKTRRRRREAVPRNPSACQDDLTWHEVREVLDREIAALPERYRLPLVLCYLQELTQAEATRRVGCSAGTFRGLLDRGREQLRKRLARYGLPLAAPILVLGEPTPVSAALVDKALRSARSGTAGGIIPSPVAEMLSHPGMRGLRDSLSL
jgi:RNA polymerase sigma factor (sigma-70 family)